MPEARTRPARQRERFTQVIRANLWFWTRMRDADDPSWDVMEEWMGLPVSVMIRRWKGSMPQESSDAGEGGEKD